MREITSDSEYEKMRCCVRSLLHNPRELLKQFIVAKTRFIFEPQRYPVQVLKLPYSSEDGTGSGDLIVESSNLEGIASIELILSGLQKINHDDSSQVESSVNRVVKLRKGVIGSGGTI